MTQEELMRLLSLAGSLGGSFGGFGGSSLLTAGATASPTPIPTVPQAPPPPPLPPPIMPNVGLPATPGYPPAAPAPPMAGSPYANTTQAPPPVAAPVPPTTPSLTPPAAPLGAMPADPKEQRNWLERNAFDPLKQWFNEGDKGDGKLTDRQKSVLGAGNSLGSALLKSATPAAAPTLAGGGGGGGVYRPAPIDSARLSEGRARELLALRQRATLQAPWLKRYQQQPGLMG